MTSNYIIHIGNNIVNKRLKISEYLNKYERRIIEKNASAFFYILINLIFDVPIERFRLVINRKYIFLKKKKKKIDVVFTITKKLLIMNNISIKERFLRFGDGSGLDESDTTWCVTWADYFPPSEHSLNPTTWETPVINDANFNLLPTWRFRPKTVLLDNAIKKNNQIINEKKDISHHSIMSNILTNANEERLVDSKRFLHTYDEHPFYGSRPSNHFLNLVGSITSEYKKEVKKKLSSYNSFYFKEIKNKMNHFKSMSSEEYYCPRTNTHCDENGKVHISASENNFAEKRSIILIKKNENKSAVNIFDEFLDIYVLFRLKGGKGGFGANLRNKKRKKKKKKKMFLMMLQEI
ncbi:hypothetical protein AK88_01388 [Plasmodium fragile]|uniref:Sde2 N-terminal ubiquitin domain-containing protein n=1 Tax=Plasmodium fragile TaxID=5857 RepID=A0A0D9QPA9_PLAFR|nr:uncharacterized protein AK88_01388 [Plasmodium fragile]KJP88894.1 hypothetical protein AK88_01388 [Plasmodium fragile]